MNEEQIAARLKEIISSPSYRLAELDTEFIQRPEQRPVRMQLELLKVDDALRDYGVTSTVVVFGGTQIVERPAAEIRLNAAKKRVADSPNDPKARRDVERAESLLAKSHFYDEAREFGRIVTSSCQIEGICDYVIVTGGGPGIMEAANRGAFDAGGISVGLNITLPQEQMPNPYITPDLCFQFHYFALRKLHFLLRAKALVVFPGGFGTCDELFDMLTLRQTGRTPHVPVVLYNQAYWESFINFRFLADEGVIADEHLKLFHYAETPEQVWQIISEFNSRAR